MFFLNFPLLYLVFLFNYFFIKQKTHENLCLFIWFFYFFYAFLRRAEKNTFLFLCFSGVLSCHSLRYVLKIFLYVASKFPFLFSLWVSKIRYQVSHLDFIGCLTLVGFSLSARCCSLRNFPYFLEPRKIIKKSQN